MTVRELLGRAVDACDRWYQRDRQIAIDELEKTDRADEVFRKQANAMRRLTMKLESALYELKASRANEAALNEEIAALREEVRKLKSEPPGEES